MKVVAKAKGQYKGMMHNVGEVFEFDENDKTNPRAPWMGDVVPLKTAPLKVAGTMLPKEGEFVQPKTEKKGE